MTDIMAMAAQLTPEEKRDLAKWLLRQRKADAATETVSEPPAAPGIEPEFASLIGRAAIQGRARFIFRKSLMVRTS